MSNLARVHLLAERLPQARRLKFFVVAGMELIQIDIIRLERLQRFIKLPEHIVRLVMDRSIHEGVKVMAEFRGNDPFFAVAPNRLPDQALRGVIAIALGGVDQVDAEVAAAVEDLIDLILRKLLPPFPTELP